jgi:hypothetical protein
MVLAFLGLRELLCSSIACCELHQYQEHHRSSNNEQRTTNDKDHQELKAKSVKIMD